MASTLGQIIQMWLKEHDLEDKVRESTVPDYWVEIVGEALSKNASVERIENGRMTIRAANTVWKQELISRREEIRRKVNERFEMEVVTDVFVI